MAAYPNSNPIQNPNQYLYGSLLPVPGNSDSFHLTYFSSWNRGTFHPSTILPNVKIGHSLFGGMIGVADGHRSGIECRGIARTLLEA